MLFDDILHVGNLTRRFGFLTIGSLVSKLQGGAMEKIHTVLGILDKELLPPF